MPEASQGVQAWDRYAYVNNNPVKCNDPSGHCLICYFVLSAVIQYAVPTLILYGSLTAVAAVGEISNILDESKQAASNYTPEPTPQMAEIMDKSTTPSTPTSIPTPMGTPQPFTIPLPSGSEIFDFVAQPNPPGDPSVIGLIPKEYLGIPDTRLQAIEFGLNSIWVFSHFYQNYIHMPNDDIYDRGPTSTPSPTYRPPTSTQQPTFQTPTPYNVTPTLTYR